MLKISVAIGRNAETKQWKNRSYFWPDFVDRLREPRRTHERYAEYMTMTRKEQGHLKDVGGYVCGYLNDGRRGKADIMSRSALTLDLDFAPLDLWPTLTMLWDCAAVLHSTHKHSRETPRYRLIVPLDREVTPDEYVAIARRFAASINIEYFDPTTFDTNRLMFWPSASADGEYVFEEQAGPALRADAVLRQYRDWRDMSEWAFSGKVAQHIHAERARKQEDPLAKNNIVGYFCGAYDIHAAIEEFLPEVYEPVGGGRYTYLQGSTASGVVTYDDCWAYSHHGSDPASGELCNAFDLVRIHKFGSADSEGSTSKSYKLMSEFCRGLKPVKKVIASAIIRRDFDEFRKPDGGDYGMERPKPAKMANAAEGAPEAGDDWTQRMDVDKFNNYEPSALNVTLIMRNDPLLAGRLRYNSFAYKKYVMKPFPWAVSDIVHPRQFGDKDTSGLQDYIEKVYRIKAPNTINNTVTLELERNAFHPVREWFDSLEWDGVPRIDRLLVDCFSVEDNAYTREVSRKWMVAAVARVMTPGCKYDTVITLVGEEGTRKSSFFRKLGGEWFSDSFTTVEGNKACEQLFGKLVIEIAELSAFDKAESVLIKHFITKGTETFRFAYAKEILDYPRQSVFVATSNNRTFLRDMDGNRRFWPVAVPLRRNTGGRLDPMGAEFEALIPQLWAEAVVLWRRGEPLILSPEAERIADEERAGHVEVDARRGIVEEYLDMDVPEGWRDMPPDMRAEYVAAPGAYRGQRAGKTYKRKYICAAEIWCECFGKRKEDLNQRMTREITAMMRSMPGWCALTKVRRFQHYGVQGGYEYKG